jgi:hypothetical protein
MTDLGSAQIIGFETRHDVAGEGTEIRGLIRQIDEDKSFRHSALGAMQPDVGQIEVCSHVPGMDQGASTVIDPLVVRANQFLRVSPLLLTNLRAAMLAHIEQRMDATIVCPDDNDGFICDLVKEIILRVGYAAYVTGTKPVVHEHFLGVYVNDAGICVELPLKRPSGG